PRGPRWVDALIECRLRGMRVYDTAGFCERVLRRLPVSHVRPAEFAFEDRLTVGKARRLAKRVFDLFASAVLLLLAAPLMLLVAILVKLDTQGPAGRDAAAVQRARGRHELGRAEARASGVCPPVEAADPAVRPSRGG